MSQPSRVPSPIRDLAVEQRNTEQVSPDGRSGLSLVAGS
jgi:hypothetical protein